MYADKANAMIAEIHDAVVSGSVYIDPRSQQRLLEVLIKSADDMCLSVKDKHMVSHYMSLLENAAIALPDAVDEVQQEVNAWTQSQEKLRWYQRNGRNVCGMLVCDDV